MSVSYATVIYPSIGASGGKSIKSVTDLSSDFMKAIHTFLEHEKIIEKEMIVLPGMNKATTMLTKAKKDAGTNDLTLRGGLDGSGNLIVSVTGILPKKSGGPEKYEKSEIVRPGFKKLLDEMKSESNVVVNMTQISEEEADKQLEELYEKYGDQATVENSTEYKNLIKKYKGDDIINRSSSKQAAKYKVTAQKDDEGDFGGLTTGTLVLCAHGGAAAVPGAVIGTSLGKRSPEEIVNYLIANPDKAKRLSKKFTGIVHLSGCYTASGSGDIPPDYDYSTFAGKVLSLLQSKGYKSVAVRGHPGPAQTKDSGDKSSRNAMVTAKGAEALLLQMQQIEKAYRELLASHGGDKLLAAADPKFAEMNSKWLKLKADRADILKNDTKAKQAALNIDGLVANMGRQGR